MLRVRKVLDLSPDEVKRSSYNLRVLACGYEERCTFVPQHFISGPADHTVVLKFSESPAAASRPAADAFFGALAARHLEISADEDAAIYSLLRELNVPGDSVSVHVDYSSMSRLWYNAILNWAQFQETYTSVTVDFTYAVGTYTGDFQPFMIRDIMPLRGCEARPRHGAKTISIFGLGYDGTVALSLVERLEPDVILAFYAAPGADLSSAKEAARRNEQFLKTYARSVICAPLSSIAVSVRLLEELALPNLGTHNVAFIPLGPKPHVLASMLAARVYAGDLSCLRVTGGRLHPVDVAAKGPVVCTRVLFERTAGIRGGA
jgi:hypothetical protein